MLGDKVKKLRIDARLSRKDMAVAIGVSSEAVRSIEQNRRNPSIEIMERIANATGSTLHIEFRK